MFLTVVFVFAALFAIPPSCQAQDDDSVGSEPSSAELLRPFEGKVYTLASSDDNFDKVLDRLGVSWVKRRVYNLARPTMVLTSNPDDGTFTLSQKYMLLEDEVTFQLGVEFPRETLDGRSIQTKFTVDGTTLLETQTEAGKPTLSVERKFDQNHVTSTLKIDDVVSHRTFNAAD